jgi:hypothetical protein
MSSVSADATAALSAISRVVFNMLLILIERNQMPVAGVGLSGHYKYSTLSFVTPAMQARPSRDLMLILGHQASAV